MKRATTKPIKVWMKFVIVIPNVNAPTATNVKSEVRSSNSNKKNNNNTAAEKIYDSTIEPNKRWDVLTPSNVAVKDAYVREPVHLLTINQAN